MFYISIFIVVYIYIELMSVPLIYIKDGSIKNIPIKDAINEIYYLKYRIPKENEITDKITVQEIKTMISSNDDYIPLYDVFSSNIYMIQKRNVYIRVVKQDYRFPDDIILKNLSEKYEENKNKLSKKPELKNDKVFMRGMRKTELIFDFIEQLDMKTIYEKYLNVFYRYSPIANLSTYTCMRKSFIPYTNHLKPYYSQDEILKLGMNMGIINISIPYVDYKDSLTNKELQDICFKIQQNDISSKILIEHQNHIIKNDMDGLILYYTIQGSYFMNKYLRNIGDNTNYQNEYLEENIIKIWKNVLNAPAFDNDYYLYRFIENDAYLSHLKIGDTYVDKGFMSTTRDPFYDTDQFGFILIKIKIPKNVKGVGLCLELISHFPNEEEIILPPLTVLKLVSKDDKCSYYHPNNEIQSVVVKKYEFEWVKYEKIHIDKRKNIDKETQVVDFLKIEKIKNKTLKEKINYFVSKYCDKMYRIKNIINNKTFYVSAEYYDSSNIYEYVYSSKVSDGFSLYTIYESYVLFMIEIYEKDGVPNLHINYRRELSKSKINEILGDENFIKYIASISYYFDIPYATIYAEFSNCLNNSVQRTNNSKNNSIKDNNNDDDFSGGKYCVDFYKYLKDGYKRYKNTDILSSELQPAFSYHILDGLRKIDPIDILSPISRDELYQIYVKTYIIDNPKNNNIIDFYIWIIENKCYMIDIYENLIYGLFNYKNRSYDNPFNKPKYELDAMCYLYNRQYVKTYNRFIKMNNEIEKSQLILPKNDYRIVR